VIVPPEMGLAQAPLTVDIRHAALQTLLHRQCILRIAPNSFCISYETPRRVHRCVPHERDISGNCHCLQRPCNWKPDVNCSVTLALSALSVHTTHTYDTPVA
jgi:hypothetical protein